MNETVLKIAASALLHDIGKLADKQTLGVPRQYIDDHAGLYLPSYDGRYSHYHAVYTAAFIERFGDLLPREFNSPGWGDGDAFINLAAGHHNPETPMQWVVAVADRVSSGWDRDVFEKGPGVRIPWQSYKKTRLLPVLEQLSLDGSGQFDRPDDFSRRYNLCSITPEAIFPKPRAEVEPRSVDEAQRQYKDLFEGFTRNLQKLRHLNYVPLWLEHFESLMMIHTSSIPAARTGNVVPDVSLYDHSKVTSALAAALYLYHHDTDTLQIECIRDYDQDKLLIVSGDFQGIQKFIFGGFGDSARYRSKILRGRSFAVSLLAEMTATFICRAIGLPWISTLLNAAGKFTILAPNTEGAKKALEAAERDINRWLFGFSYGETVINVSTVEASCGDFVSGRFVGLWERITRTMAEKKFESLDLASYGGVVAGYLDRFVNEPEHPPVCQLCGRRPSDLEAAGSAYVKNARSACRHCRDHVFLGANVVKRDILCVVDMHEDIADPGERLFEPLLGRYQVVFPDKHHERSLERIATAGGLIKFWNLTMDPAVILESDSAVRYINSYVPKYGPSDKGDDCSVQGARSEKTRLEAAQERNEGDPKTLSDIACKALKPSTNGKGLQGVAALGVLKADVDCLGLLMSCGLKDERFTVSRLATLSRQVDFFFTVYLSNLLRTDPRFKDVYTIFAGGDDLFLIGPWNIAIDLAALLSERFSDYVCGNDELHFSAGISFHKSQTPLDFMAREAEEALGRSKENGRNRLSVFGETATWETVERLLPIRQEIAGWLEKGWVSEGLLYRLNEYIRMAATEEEVVQDREVALDDIACVRWRALLFYTMERNVAKKIRGDLQRETVAYITGRLVEWLETYQGKLRIPLWGVLYNLR